jgi:hypothetical protein
MKKNGPQETAYASLYWAEDETKIRKMFLEGRGEEFNLMCRKRYDDHKSDIEIMHVARTEDIPTYPGLSTCMMIIIGVSGAVFHFMIAGTDNSQARPYQQGLLGEVTPRIDISLPGNGSITTAAGPPVTMTFTGIFASSFPTATIRESAISTASPGGTYLNRNMFSSSPITHTAGVTGFTLQSVFTVSDSGG